ncbi:BrnA antitoxin family protein [Phyllobacterium ifriqiyense]|uniref:BrnA antitoxin family protein n=1 Tax=Phyllobacterium ifriqiyense TaxID=314238 RepID=UPI0033917AD1
MNIPNRRVSPFSDEEEAKIQAGIANDPDNPEWTEEELKNARPFREVFPELAKKIDEEIAKRGRPLSATTKQPVTIRLDPDVIAKFKATGKGWQSRINEVLRQAKV